MGVIKLLCGLVVIKILCGLGVIKVLYGLGTAVLCGLGAINSVLLRVINYNHHWEFPYTISRNVINPDDGREETITETGRISYVLVLLIPVLFIHVLDLALQYLDYIALFVLVVVLIPAFAHYGPVVHLSIKF